MNIQTEIHEKKGFTPVTVTIDIVTEEELCDLWLRINTSNTQIKEDNKLHDLKHELLDSEHILPFWRTINNLVTKFGLRGKQYERKRTRI